MSKFKPGDTVRCISRDFKYISFGETAIVVDVGSHSFKESIYLKTPRGRIFSYQEDYFELVTEEKPKLYFTNFSRDLITYEEAVQLLSENTGGTIYKKVAEVKVETKKTVSVNKLE